MKWNGVQSNEGVLNHLGGCSTDDRFDGGRLR